MALCIVQSIKGVLYIEQCVLFNILCKVLGATLPRQVAPSVADPPRWYSNTYQTPPCCDPSINIAVTFEPIIGFKIRSSALTI